MKQEEFYKSSSAKDQPIRRIDKYEMAMDLIAQRKPKLFLDLGCGDGSFSQALKQATGMGTVFGIEIDKEAALLAASKGIRVLNVNIDRQDLPFRKDVFEVIFCGELIEHLYDPDHLLQEIHRVMARDGICILTTPNLASWYNRIALLLGYQPFFTEVSTKYGVGYMLPFWLNAGHIRVFTLRAISELLKKHSFNIQKIRGCGINTGIGLGKKFSFFANLTNPISRIFPSLSSDLFIVFSK